MSTPLISVILPVYNGEKYLNLAIKSILLQSYRKFELLIIDDGSKDSSWKIINKLDDSRIRKFRQKNIGLAATLNKAIGLARGQFIARQDQDDISLESRLLEQITYMNKNKNIQLMGTWGQIIHGDTKTSKVLRTPSKNIDIQFNLLFDNCLIHSSVMARTAVLKKTGGYSTDPLRQPPEDYELWSRIARNYEFFNIPKVLINYREVQGSMSRISKDPFRDKVVKISTENIHYLLDERVSFDKILSFTRLYHGLFSDLNYFEAKKILDLVSQALAAKWKVNEFYYLTEKAKVVRKLKINYLENRFGPSVTRIARIFLT